MKINGTQWIEIIRAISTAIIAIITTLCVQSCTMSLSVSKNNQNSTQKTEQTTTSSVDSTKINKINNNKKNFLIMAATKFTAIYVNNEGKIIEREIPGMNTYKIAEKFAIMLNDPEETKLVGVIETWKMYPNNYEKTEKEDNLGSKK